jgi:leucyl-tRNA synthetase
MTKYNPKEIESKWQKYWEENKTFEVKKDDNKQKFYSLIEFPYPSGAGLHVGHPRPFTAMDVISRKKRMEGLNVLYPIGFDAFGLPTENYAIKTGRPPAEVTAENIANFTRQLKMLGFSFDWSRAVDTTDPDYYKWTQSIFLKFFKHGLAYKKNMPINWCISCKIGLANEEVVDGKCERCGGEVEKRDKKQWMLAITKYADKLLEGLEEVDYIKQAKTQQQNWIGRKTGINIEYNIDGMDEKVVCFTTRPDTNFGATFVVVGPEHPLLLEITTKENEDAVKEYISDSKKKNDMDRMAEGKEKSGVFTGAYCINKLNNKKLPIWVADYVLGNVGTGAVIGVPGHDKRDFEFADKYDLPVERVVVMKDGDNSEITNIDQVQEDNGKMINSEFLDGLDIHEATEKMMDHMEKDGWGERVVNYKLRDWVFSRQRYWGEPIPLVHCDNCEQRKNKILMIHGLSGDSEENWFPWAKIELEKLGYEVLVPNLPDSDEPKLENWLQALESLGISHEDNISIIGHSLGAPTACQFILKNKLNIENLILVAPVGKDHSKENWDNLRQAGIEEKSIQAAKKFIEKNNNIEEINKYCKVIKLYFSDDDPYISLSVQDFYSSLNAEVETLSGKGHFNTSSGITSFSEMIKDFKEVNDLNNGWIPLPEDQLPLTLPEVEKYEPTDTGESPLAVMTDWIKTECPTCGGEARRETDTMPNWAGSSWYYLRYMDPNNDKEFASQEMMKYWGAVDWYNGGMEHTVLHLLYSRFWNQFLHDIGEVPFKEPYKKRTSHGMILAKGGEKMSKSKGNVVNPDEMVERFGADALRTYIMFMGPFDQAVEWDTNGLVGVRRFLDRVYNLQSNIVEVKNNSNINRLSHQTIKKVTEDIDKMHFNTAIAKMMEFVNEVHKVGEISSDNYKNLIKILSPFASHMCEEIWNKLGHDSSIAFAEWPKYDEEMIKEDVINLVVQINGKVRGNIEVPADISEEDAKEKALGEENVKKWLEDKDVKKVIYVKGRLVSVVV